MHDSDAQLQERSPDPAIASLAAAQYGVVSRAQLIDLGVERGAIALRLERGRLHVIHRGVYGVGHRLLTRQGRWMAAVLAGGAGAVLSHRSAAAHWGVLPPSSREADVTVSRSLRCRRGLRFHHSRLPADEVTVRDGIPVTSTSRTLLDLAAVLNTEQLRRAAHEAEVRRLWDHVSLADLLARHPRRPGAAAVRAIVAAPDQGITRNRLERRFLAVLDRHGLPRPATNVAMHAGHHFIEPDCVWRRERVIVELDGHATHGTRASFEDDRARDRALVAAGWRVIRITWRQLRDEPAAVAGDVRAALARR